MAPAGLVSSSVISPGCPAWARSLLGSALLALSAVSLSGCVALSYVFPLYGQLSNASDPACAGSLSTEVTAALEQQGEKPEDSTGAAGRAVRSLAALQGKPMQFEAASSSGVSYWFSFEPRRSGCLLKLFERHKNGAVTSNTITYYARRRLTGCTCDWVWYHESNYP